jgi:hypothetical protein
VEERVVTDKAQKLIKEFSSRHLNILFERAQK